MENFCEFIDYEDLSNHPQYQYNNHTSSNNGLGGGGGGEDYNHDFDIFGRMEWNDYNQPYFVPPPSSSSSY